MVGHYGRVIPTCEEDIGSNPDRHKQPCATFSTFSFLVPNHSALSVCWLLELPRYLCAARGFAGVVGSSLRCCPANVAIKQRAKHCMQGEIQSAGVARVEAQLQYIKSMSFFYIWKASPLP
jgi:hypothetical protein